ncbi:RNA polymerase I-specific transcription initiation factor RRN3 [Suillus fuscotomentosus]|uniref:RNA polymerase I-specific transcription initiation factor RRN3 n=1 Tax=Suillus fuscotomentosus TaxID=1912939 RepID=A0AAD4DY93_9AGAM|nr:RNA polymerase I-specific transcription initiation factor RRN3 [Suillus fuscotomentosus]KAG1896316.1 RNA polymerase I-specific transcription initiation factor RRN3 [Suillus fuscotomentosus]
MDPHSRLSQFNQRTPKAGPFSPSVRFEPTQKVTLDKYTKAYSSSMPSDSPLFTSRPIATNSRVKQDEQFKKDMFLAYVNKAIREKLNGHSKDFDDVVDQFSPNKSTLAPTVSSLQLRIWLSALSHVLSRLERRHAPLVEAIVRLPWSTMDAVFVKSYIVFIGMLISARPEYLSLVLNRIAMGFTYQSGLLAVTSNLEGSTPLTRRVIYDRQHTLLEHLLNLVPTLPSSLAPLLVRNFPHKRQPQAAHVAYIRNLLRITEYCDELSERVLGLIVDRALMVDVEIQVELEELEDAEPTDGELFEFDPFDTIIGQEGNSSDDEDVDDSLSDLSSDASSDSDAEDTPMDTRHVHDMVSKLDAILKLVFDHFNKLHSSILTVVPSSPSIHPTTTHDRDPQSHEPHTLLAIQFHTLLAIFDRSILRTFKSRYTQFLLFWYASLHPEFSDLFLGLLVDKALFGSASASSVERAAASSYIGSFVSRAQFIDREGARRAVKVLCAFLGAHLDAVEAGNAASNNHSVFYAVVQSVFLVFCFRWRDLQEEPDEQEVGRKIWISELGVVQRVITSDLNPLKVCSQNVVHQFARIAQATDFTYCFSILEANKRTPYPVFAGVAPGSAGPEDLHTFFPFDPFKLPRSGEYIQGVYREWAAVAIDDEEEEDEDDLIEEDSTFNEWEHGQGGSCIPITASKRGESDDDGLGASFGGMSISPARTRTVAMAISVS